MTIRSQFFDSIAGDRIYTANDFSAHLGGIYSDGIIPENDSDALKVLQSVSPGKSVRVSIGKCFIQGRFVEIFNAAETLTVPDNNTGLNRLDSVKVRINFVTRTGELFYDTGNNVSQPSPVRTDQVWELILARVTVANGFTQVLQANILDQRNDIFFCGKSKPTTLRQNFQNVPGAGWKRIAVSNGFFQTLEPQAGNLAFANFVLRTFNATTGANDQMNITAGGLNGQPSLSVNGRTRNNAAMNIDGIRVVYDPSFVDGRVALEVNVSHASATCIFEINNNYSPNGWFPVNWTAGSIPGGFSVIELNFTFADMVFGAATAAEPTNAFALTRGGSFVLRSDILLDNAEALQFADTGFTYRDYVSLNASNQFLLGQNIHKMIQKSSVLPGLDIAGDTTKRTTFYAERLPTARATQTSAQAVANLTPTTMNFQVENFDTDNIVDLGTSASNFVAKTAGYYQVTADFSLATSTAGTFRQIGIYKNGTIIAQQRIHPPNSTSVLSVGTIIDAAVNDIFTVQLLHDAGVSLNTSILTNVPHFAIALISSNDTLPT